MSALGFEDSHPRVFGLEEPAIHYLLATLEEQQASSLRRPVEGCESFG